jgi:hypothetical protein
VKVRGPIAMVPVRAAPVFAATENITAPSPRPREPAVTVIHGTLLDAPQSQTLSAWTEMDPDAPAAGTFWAVGDIRILQSGGAAAD